MCRRTDGRSAVGKRCCRAPDHVDRRRWDTRFGIGIPLLNRQRQLVGAMLLFLDEQPGAALVSFARAPPARWRVRSKRARTGSRHRRNCSRSFVQLIAVAIDAKSPYTGGHCARVPELSKMLARAACEATGRAVPGFPAVGRQMGNPACGSLAARLRQGDARVRGRQGDEVGKRSTTASMKCACVSRFSKRDAEIAALKEVAAGADPVATTLALNETQQARR